MAARSSQREIEDLVLKCAYLVAVGDAHLADEEQQHISLMRGQVQRMLQARRAIEAAEAGDWKTAREHFDGSAPVSLSMEGIFDLPPALMEIHEERVAVQSQDELAELEKRTARSLTDPFYQKVAYISCMQAALADDELSDAERQTLRILGDEWNLGHGEAVSWYNNIAAPVLTGEGPPDEQEQSGPGSEADRLLQMLLSGSDGEESEEDALAELRRLLGMDEEEGEPDDTDTTPPPPLYEAILAGDVVEVKHLIEQGQDVRQSVRGGSLLTHAMLHEQFEIADELVRHGADINEVGEAESTPLTTAIHNQVEPAVQYALEHGADANKLISVPAQGDDGPISVSISPLGLAAQRQSARVVQLLIAHGADVNHFDGFGFTPLMWAIREHNNDAMTLLIEAGANTDFDPPDNLPAEHLARLNPLLASATNGNLPALRLLLSRGVRTDVVDGTGASALKHCAQAGSSAMVEALLAARADPNIADREGWTALLSAAWREHPPVVRALLDAGADPNVQATHGDAAGWTPLIAAAFDAAEPIVRDLLAAGADPSLEDANGMTAADHVNEKLEEEDDEDKLRSYERIKAMLEAKRAT